MAAQQRAFIEKYLPSVALTSDDGAANAEAVARATAFIIGSDQVWRPRYADPSSMLLRFLGGDDTRPKFSYAASFGRSDLEEWTPAYINQTRPLAQRLDGVSVRESSGVDMAKQLWNVEAIRHVDPTLLIPAADYLSLAGDASRCAPTGGLVDYVLDQRPDALQTVKDVADFLGTETTSLMPRHAPSHRNYRQNEPLYRRPSVETWLATIAHAGFVVTDSFHGTVFSLLNNVPFLVLVNHERGATRIRSLLNLFGLERWAVEPGTLVDSELMSRPIDWTAVNTQVKREQGRSIKYLRDMLRLM